MTFESVDFILFFLAVFGVYWALSPAGPRAQNAWLVGCGVLFYATWDWRFLALLAAQAAQAYGCARRIAAAQEPSLRRRWLWTSLALAFAALAATKYFGFFADSFLALAHAAGWKTASPAWRIALPLGISFYTFQLVGYVVDVYRRHEEPEKDPLRFALFAAFFPQMIAGPIERARNLLPQIRTARKFDARVADGFYLIAWGLFEKLFIADNLLRIVDPVYAAVPREGYDGFRVFLASVGVFFHVLCDFDGYSNVARGLAMTLGFDLTVNFRWPFFKTNPADYWKGWHVSLTDWFRDYVYYPLTFGGRSTGVARARMSLVAVMALVGLWHGAKAHYLLWGAYQGALLVAYQAVRPVWARAGAGAPEPVRWVRTAVSYAFFVVVVIAVSNVLFWAADVARALQMSSALLSPWRWKPDPADWELAGQVLFFAWPMILVGSLQASRRDVLAALHTPVLLRAVFYVTCFYLLVIYRVEAPREFIYVRF